MAHPRLSRGLSPSYPGAGFLQALGQENVECVWNGIASISETGIVTTDGRELDVDAIFCATGFDYSYQPYFQLIGRNDVSLAQRWQDGDPEGYFGTTVSGFPNYFMFIGPNPPVSNVGLPQGIQAQAIYIYKCMEKMQTQGIRSMDVRL